MEHFAGPHLVAIGATVAAATLLASAPRHWPPLRGRASGAAFAAVIAVAWIYAHVDDLRSGVSAANDLPLHLSDWSVAAAVVALIARWRPAVELTWFWGLAGATWAVLTPDVSRGFEDLGTWAFFIAHSGVIAAACYLVLGCGLAPTRGAFGRALLATAAAAAVAAMADVTTGGNYMFLREPPASGSLLDLMGPWPWYLVSATIAAVALLWALEWPFRSRFGRAGK